MTLKSRPIRPAVQKSHRNLAEDEPIPMAIRMSVKLNPLIRLIMIILFILLLKYTPSLKISRVWSSHPTTPIVHKTMNEVRSEIHHSPAIEKASSEQIVEQLGAPEMTKLDEETTKIHQ